MPKPKQNLAQKQEMIWRNEHQPLATMFALEEQEKVRIISPRKPHYNDRTNTSCIGKSTVYHRERFQEACSHEAARIELVPDATKAECV